MLFVAQYIPPHSPSATASEIAAIFEEHSLRIRLGMFIMLAGACLYLPWTAVITQQLKRIEGSFSLLSSIQLASGALTVYMFALPAIIWAAAAFRPERDPQLIYLFNDLAWMMFVGMFSPFWFSPVTTGVAALIDRSSDPIFPRWTGYFSLWVAALLVPGAMLMFFKTGPFAWDGLIAFWVPLVATVSWFAVMFVFIRAAIRRDAVLAN